jgi:hypothetical protein
VIRREHFFNKLREIGYKYKREGDRAFLYKRPNDPSYVAVPRSDFLDDAYVRATLLRAGCSVTDVETFIAGHQAGH